MMKLYFDNKDVVEIVMHNMHNYDFILNEKESISLRKVIEILLKSKRCVLEFFELTYAWNNNLVPFVQIGDKPDFSVFDKYTDYQRINRRKR